MFHVSSLKSATSSMLKVNYIPFPRLLQVIKDFKPDTVLTNLPYYVPKIAKFTDRTVLYHMGGNIWNELNYDILHQPNLFSRIYHYFLKSQFDLNIPNVDIILANSKWLSRIVTERLTTPVEVFYRGISPDEWIPNKKKMTLKHPAVVAVFDFNAYEKVMGLLKFLEVIKEMPNVNFYIAGSGPYFNLVMNACPKNLTFLGRLSKIKTLELLNSADVFIHPSGLDVLPRSVKEASLMEKAIVASNIGGIPEIVKDNITGYLCDLNKPEDWRERIYYFLENPEIAEKFGKEARKYVIQTFSWDGIAKSFINNLKQISVY